MGGERLERLALPIHNHDEGARLTHEDTSGHAGQPPGPILSMITFSIIIIII